jgi:hypothetical protein
MENDLDALAARIEALERRNRRLTWALVGAAAASLALLAGSGAASPKGTVLEANEFVLRDAEGAKRGEVLVGPDGGGRIVLYGPDGHAAAELPMTTQTFPLRH